MTFIGVAGRDSADSAREFIDGLGVGGFTHVIDLELEIWREYQIPDQPAWAFINNDGTVEVYVGPLGLDGITSAVESLIES